jgi:hypothetical protein
MGYGVSGYSRAPFHTREAYPDALVEEVLPELESKHYEVVSWKEEHIPEGVYAQKLKSLSIVAPGKGTTGETDGSRTKVHEAPLYPGRSERGAAVAKPEAAKVMRASFWKTIVWFHWVCKVVGKF